jgi:predicted  nucleic acid-binding Zn-ribbon protein
MRPKKEKSVRKLSLLAILVCALAIPLRGLAEEPGPSVAGELVKIHAVLEKISNLLAQQTDSADLDLLMKRVQLAQSQATDLERQVRGAGMRLQGLQDEKRSIELQITIGQASQESDEGGELSPSMVEAMEQNWEEQRKNVSQRIASTTAELAEAQSRLDESNAAVHSWQEVLDRRLANR